MLRAAKWQWQDEHGNWKDYRPADNDTIENSTGTCTIMRGRYVVDKLQKFQQNVQYKTKRPIKRIGGAPAAGAATKRAPKATMWNCSKCTFLNQVVDFYCTMCGVGSLSDVVGAPAPSASQSIAAPARNFAPPAPTHTFAAPTPAPARRSHRPAPAPSSFMNSFFSSTNIFGSYSAVQNNNQSSNTGESLFVDPKELERKNAEKERKRIEKETKEGKQKIEWLKHVLRNQMTEENVLELLKLMYEEADDGDHSEKQEQSDVCKACYCPFNESDTMPVKLFNCGHHAFCQDCFQTYLRVRIKDEDVMPWIPCPSEDCRAKIHFKNLTCLERKEILQLILTILKKHLARNSNWVPCKNEDCNFGFLVFDEGKHDKRCAICNTKQTVTKSVLEDESMKAMLKEGTIRKCPKCENLTMKDKGICNIMQCDKCSIWWNWRTRETGNNQREMKAKSKQKGTLWEPGELQYQQRLQRDNPDEFRQLLGKNGIKYDPNYVRGRW